MEAVPVLCGVVRIDVCLHLGLLELVFHIFLRHVLTLVCQFLVHLYTAVGRSIGAHLNILYVEAFAVGIDFLKHLDELLNGIAL